jgi:hypothetical protein
MRTLGLEPAGPDGSWFQEVPFVDAVSLTTTSLLRVRIQEEWVSLELGRDATAYGWGGNGRFNAPMVFAGYGISSQSPQYDDYAGVDVRDRVVLVLTGGPRLGDPEGPFGKDRSDHSVLAKARRAQNLGAVALLVISDPLRNDGDGDLLTGLGGPGPKVDIPVLHVKRWLGERILKGRSGGLLAWQEKIERSFRPDSADLSSVHCEGRIQIRRVQKTTRNVMGMLKGRDRSRKNEVLLLGAHYDAIGRGRFGSRTPVPGGRVHNGADDNASGVASLLELAEALCGLPRSPRRSLLFVFFGAEERGLIGSTYYVEHPVVPLEQTVVMVNLDMIGQGPVGRLGVCGVGTARGFEGLLRSQARKSGMRLVMARSGMAPTDSRPFYQREVPVLFFSTGLHDRYHTVLDDWEWIDLEACRVATRFVFGVVWHLAEVRSRYRYQAGEGVDYLKVLRMNR